MNEENPMHASVWAGKELARRSFNTQPMPLREAQEYALRLAQGGRRLVRVYRAAPMPSFVTSDLLMEITTSARPRGGQQCAAPPRFQHEGEHHAGD